MDRRTYLTVVEEHSVEIKRGDCAGLVLTYKQKGNEEYGYQCSNLIVTLEEAEEPECPFKRSGSNLLYTHTLSLQDALDAKPIQVQMLDGRLLKLNIDSYITP